MSAQPVPAGPPPAAAMVPSRYRVLGTRRESADTATLWLAPDDGGPVAFAPGQFSMLHAFGVGEVPISISGDPAVTDALRYTVRDVGAVTHAIVTSAPGTVVGVRGPFGTGWRAEDGRDGDLVLVAGGIGLAPLRPALAQVCAARSRFRRVALRYGARTPQDLLFAADLQRWGAEHDVEVQVVVDAGGPGYAGRVGLVTQLLDPGLCEPARTLALLCGPEVMMRHGARALLDLGVPAHRIRLSMERSMKCGVGLCGHCQLRELFICVDGPVLGYDRLGPLLAHREAL